MPVLPLCHIHPQNEFSTNLSISAAMIVARDTAGCELVLVVEALAVAAASVVRKGEWGLMCIRLHLHLRVHSVCMCGCGCVVFIRAICICAYIQLLLFALTRLLELLK